jgi:PAS domain S-box-containing protein
MEIEQGFDLAPCALVILSHRHIQTVNQAFLDLFGYSRQELLQQNMSILFPSLEEYQRVGEAAWQGLAQAQHHAYSDQRFMRHKTGRLLWTHTQGRTLTPHEPFLEVIWYFQCRQDHQSLSHREQQIMHWVAEGYRYKHIAKVLGLSHRTIEAQVAHLMKKLGVQHKQQLQHYAVAWRSQSHETGELMP